MTLSWSTNFPPYSTPSQLAYSSIFPWLLVTPILLTPFSLVSPITDKNCIGSNDDSDCCQIITWHLKRTLSFEICDIHSYISAQSCYLSVVPLFAILIKSIAVEGCGGLTQVCLCLQTLDLEFLISLTQEPEALLYRSHPHARSNISYCWFFSKALPPNCKFQ